MMKFPCGFSLFSLKAVGLLVATFNNCPNKKCHFHCLFRDAQSTWTCACLSGRMLVGVKKNIGISQHIDLWCSILTVRFVGEVVIILRYIGDDA